MRYILKYKWTVSRGRDTYGYNICTLYVDGRKVAACNGGGYDMQGTVLGDWVARNFESQLRSLKREFYGLTFHDPNFNPGKAKIKEDWAGDPLPQEMTVEEAEKAGKSLGLQRYQAFYQASSPVPTWKHVIPLIDGAVGRTEVEKILKKIGFRVECLDYEDRIYMVTDEGGE